MKQTTRNILLGAALLYIVASLVFGSFNPTQWSVFQKEQQAYVPVAGGASGIFDVATKGYNSLDISSVLNENSNYYCYWYAYRGGWIMLGKGDTSIELTDVDMGSVSAVVKVPGGQSYYVDWAETKTKNPRVISVAYEDPDGDGYKEFVFKVSMSNIPKPASGNPKIFFYPYFLAYEKPTMFAPSDITGIGTARSIRYIEWYTYFANVKRAFAVTKVELTLNTTDTAKVAVQSMAIPGLGSVSGDMFGTPVRNVNSLTWTYSIGSNLYNANYIKYGANMLNKAHFTTQVECQLSAGDVLELTITVYGLTETGTLTTLTDTVVLRAS